MMMRQVMNRVQTVVVVCVVMLVSTVMGVSDAAGQASSVRAEVVSPQRRAMTRSLSAPGSLMADEQVEVYAKTSGYVKEIRTDIGSVVSRGDLLVEIDVPEMQDEVRQAEAVLSAKRARVMALQVKVSQSQRMVETAKAQVRRAAAKHDLNTLNLRRIESLREGNAISEQALDTSRSEAAISEAQLRIAEAMVAGAEAEKQAVDADRMVAEADAEVAEADLSRWRTLMSYASIRAPFDGIITVRNVDHGTFVRSAEEGMTSALLRIVKVDRIRVAVDVAEVDAPFVRVGTEAEVVVPSLGDAVFSASVSRTSGALDPATRSLRVEIDLENKTGQLISGMYAQVTLGLETVAQAIMIPSKALRVEEKATVVFVAEGGKVVVRAVTVGYDDGIWAEITSGLSGSESVITATSSAVRPGTVVSEILSKS